jgi:pyruvate dehydrogenase (quinone)
LRPAARQELIMPLRTTPAKTTHGQGYEFGMFLVKAVLDGRASELVDLAGVNLKR